MAMIKPTGLGILPASLRKTMPAHADLLQRAETALRGGDANAALRLLNQARQAPETSANARRALLGAMATARAQSGLETAGFSSIEAAPLAPGAALSDLGRDRLNQMWSRMIDRIRDRERALGRRRRCPVCGSDDLLASVPARFAGRYPETAEPFASLLLDPDEHAGMLPDPASRAYLLSHLIDVQGTVTDSVDCGSCGAHLLACEIPDADLDAVLTAPPWDALTMSDTGVALAGSAHRPGDSARRTQFPLFVNSVLGGLTGKRVLDVGCHDGFTLFCLALMGVTKGAGADINPAHIAYARQVMGVNVGNLDRRRNGTDLPAGPYDVALSVDLLHRYPDPTAAAAEIRQRLVPGGRLVLVLPHARMVWAVRSHGIGALDPVGFDEIAIRTLLTKAGFTVQTIKVAGPELEDRLRVGEKAGIWCGRETDMLVVASRPA